jgi:regulator of sigma E protease
MPLRPTREAGELASVGISGPQSLELSKEDPVVPDSAADHARLTTPVDVTAASAQNDADKKDGNKGEDDPRKLRGGDTIVSVNGVPVADYREYVAELVKGTDKPLSLEVRRTRTKPENDDSSSKKDAAADTELLQFELPTQAIRGLGIVMKMGPIVAVQDHSPADKAGVKAGDRIVAVDGKPSVDADEDLNGWTPLTLPEYLRKAAADGRDVTLTIRRGASDKSDGEELTFTMQPVMPKAISPMLPTPGDPTAADAVGVAYSVQNQAHAISPSGAAAKEGVEPGDWIASAKVYWPPNKKTGKARDPEEVELGRQHLNWSALMESLQFVPEGTQVELRLLRGENSEPIKVKLAPQEVAGVHISPRGVNFEPIVRVRTATSLAEAVRWGFDETADALTMVFRFLQKLGSQVPLKMLGGPGTIAAAAGIEASKGVSSLLIFLTMLSANLAVINFLPIPLLDGGHMMFLTYEGLRGRPANEKIVLGLHMAGFVFIIGLMVFVIGLDIHRWILT